MPQADPPSPAPQPAANNVPDGVAKGIIGFALGAGLTFLAMYYYGPEEQVPTAPPPTDTAAIPGDPLPSAGGGAAPAGMGGGANGAAEKRNLTALVGKLELLTRDHLHVEFEQEQAAKLADELAPLEKIEAMTGEDAKSRLEALEALLTPEQKEIVDSIDLPFAGASGGPGGSGSSPDENPFTQPANEKRLQDLLERVKPAESESQS